MEEQIKRGSIALARRLCVEIAGYYDEDHDLDGSQYGSVDVAEILSAEIVRLRAELAAVKQQLAEAESNIKATITSMIDGLIKTVSVDIDDDDQLRAAAWALEMLKSQIAEINLTAACTAHTGGNTNG